MSAVRPLTPAFTLTTLGQADLAWLRGHIGADRVRGPMVDEDGDWEVELTRADGRKTWFFERSPDAALARARAHVQDLFKNRKVAG